MCDMLQGMRAKQLPEQLLALRSCQEVGHTEDGGVSLGVERLQPGQPVGELWQGQLRGASTALGWAFFSHANLICW